ncbi:hypothetical protein V494_04590 [Pseudogymnoascus sp. VKM F-4513 (FW-928)]|nr:hypothetical protein V494_04590 [Pseudogymnoascus sp. VKM F-4513 (FW-928)]
MASEASGFSLEYEALVGLINTRLSGGPLDIQILPDASMLLSSGLAEIINNTLGVPKAVLAKAFIAARRIFFEHLDNLTENVELILDSTSVILLFDPEHITAANARKKVCLAFRSRPHSEQTQRLKDELWFNKFLVTSKLKRHNKSPTLWSHRKWLMKNFHTLEGLLGPKWVEFETEEVVLISAEHHPKNYYAWDYMRWLIKSRPGLDPRAHPAINRQLPLLMRSWCMHHTSDSSGWSFLAWMLLRHPDPEPGVSQDMQVDAADKILEYALRLNLKNLSLWMFLQEVVGLHNSVAMEDVKMEYMQQLSEMRAREPRGSALQVFAKNSLLRIGAN